MNAHLRILLRARLAGLRNAWSRQERGRIIALVVGGLAVCGAALGLGEIAWEGLAAAPDEVATMRLGDQPIAGENALEAAFWLTFLAASAMGFRVMEVLFRRGEMRMLDRLPISPTALFLDRSVVASSEAALAAVPLGLFFVPLAVHGYGWAALSAMLLIVCGLVCTVAICLGANIYIGVQFGAPQARGLSDAYGGSGGAFIYGPAAGMFGSAIAALVLKLAAGEVLKAEGWSNAVGLGAGIAFAFAIALFLTGLRDYRQGAHLVTAWFNEADSVGFEAVIDYQTSTWQHAAWEHRLPGRSTSVYRRLELELPRRHPLARWIYGLGIGASLVGLWTASAEAFPVWVPLAVAIAMLGVLVSPWTQARSLPGASAYEWLPISTHEERLAAGVRGLRVSTMVVLGLAGALSAGTALGGRPFDESLLVVAIQLLAFPTVVTGLMLAIPYSRWKSAGRAVPVIVGTVFLGSALIGTTPAWIAAGVLMAAAAVPLSGALAGSEPGPRGEHA